MAEDWRKLTGEERDAVREALERIDDDPIIGAPLFEPLRGIWSYRSGGLRILYQVAPEARMVVVLKIGRAGG
ncbi:MAG TPA: type II toxin-antitoxin system RelE/ParE family toxin [Thermoanaerobaculia bacterium]|nr:type II toxin-antitoxin system RelE/ParE family toxin [Thermoanaerobaculia bacterium]